MDGYIKKSEAVDVIVKYPYNIAGKTATAIRMIEDLPSADVVPKSEVEWLYKQVDCLSQEVMYNDDIAKMKVDEAKIEVASEIFEEIERTFNAVLVGDISDILKVLAELKKKYTE